MFVPQEEGSIPMDLTTSNQPTRHKLSHEIVSTRYKIQTADASYLCLFDISLKVGEKTTYDIGGSWTGEVPDFWFFFTTSCYNSQNYLLNIFVCHRKAGKFSIEISNSSEVKEKPSLNKDMEEIFYTLPKSFDKYSFKSAKVDEMHYIKSFSYGIHLNLPKESVLLIPIKITDNPICSLDENIVKSVKLQHDLSGLLTMHEKTDLVLESASKKQYLTHKIVLAAHSRVLRDLIRNMKKQTTLFIDISDSDMDLLLEFIYTGTMKDMLKQDCMKILEIADKFELKALFTLAQHVIDMHIKIENAIEMAIIAKKYKLKDLLNKVFDFISKNPKVVKSQAFSDLKDIELAKHLIEYLQTQAS